MSSSNEWVATRNRHTNRLRLLAAAARGPERETLQWAAQHLEGLPENWIAMPLESSAEQDHPVSNP